MTTFVHGLPEVTPEYYARLPARNVDNDEGFGGLLLQAGQVFAKFVEARGVDGELGWGERFRKLIRGCWKGRVGSGCDKPAFESELAGFNAAYREMCMEFFTAADGGARAPPITLLCFEGRRGSSVFAPQSPDLLIKRWDSPALALDCIERERWLQAQLIASGMPTLSSPPHCVVRHAGCYYTVSALPPVHYDERHRSVASASLSAQLRAADIDFFTRVVLGTDGCFHTIEPHHLPVSDLQCAVWASIDLIMQDHVASAAGAGEEDADADAEEEAARLTDVANRFLAVLYACDREYPVEEDEEEEEGGGTPKPADGEGGASGSSSTPPPPPQDKEEIVKEPEAGNEDPPPAPTPTPPAGIWDVVAARTRELFPDVKIGAKRLKDAMMAEKSQFLFTLSESMGAVYKERRLVVPELMCLGLTVPTGFPEAEDKKGVMKHCFNTLPKKPDDKQLDPFFDAYNTEKRAYLMKSCMKDPSRRHAYLLEALEGKTARAFDTDWVEVARLAVSMESRDELTDPAFGMVTVLDEVTKWVLPNAALHLLLPLSALVVDLYPTDPHFRAYRADLVTGHTPVPTGEKAALNRNAAMALVKFGLYDDAERYLHIADALARDAAEAEKSPAAALARQEAQHHNDMGLLYLHKGRAAEAALAKARADADPKKPTVVVPVGAKKDPMADVQDVRCGLDAAEKGDPPVMTDAALRAAAARQRNRPLQADASVVARDDSAGDAGANPPASAHLAPSRPSRPSNPDDALQLLVQASTSSGGLRSPGDRALSPESSRLRLQQPLPAPDEDDEDQDAAVCSPGGAGLLVSAQSMRQKRKSGLPHQAGSGGDLLDPTPKAGAGGAQAGRLSFRRGEVLSAGDEDNDDDDNDKEPPTAGKRGRAAHAVDLPMLKVLDGGGGDGDAGSDSVKSPVRVMDPTRPTGIDSPRHSPRSPQRSPQRDFVPVRTPRSDGGGAQTPRAEGAAGDKVPPSAPTPPAAAPTADHEVVAVASYEKAAGCFEKTIALASANDAHRALSHDMTAEAYNSLGIVHARMRRFDDAARAFAYVADELYPDGDGDGDGEEGTPQEVTRALENMKALSRVREEAAATNMQRVYRGHASRKEVGALKGKRAGAHLTLTRVGRGYIDRFYLRCPRPPTPVVLTAYEATLVNPRSDPLDVFHDVAADAASVPLPFGTWSAAIDPSVADAWRGFYNTRLVTAVIVEVFLDPGVRGGGDARQVVLTIHTDNGIQKAAGHKTFTHRLTGALRRRTPGSNYCEVVVAHREIQQRDGDGVVEKQTEEAVEEEVEVHSVRLRRLKPAATAPAGNGRPESASGAGDDAALDAHDVSVTCYGFAASTRVGGAPMDEATTTDAEPLLLQPNPPHTTVRCGKWVGESGALTSCEPAATSATTTETALVYCGAAVQEMWVSVTEVQGMLRGSVVVETARPVAEGGAAGAVSPVVSPRASPASRPAGDGMERRKHTLTGRVVAMGCGRFDIVATARQTQGLEYRTLRAGNTSPRGGPANAPNVPGERVAVLGDPEPAQRIPPGAEAWAFRVPAFDAGLVWLGRKAASPDRDGTCAVTLPPEAHAKKKYSTAEKELSGEMYELRVRLDEQMDGLEAQQGDEAAALDALHAAESKALNELLAAQWPEVYAKYEEKTTAGWRADRAAENEKFAASQEQATLDMERRHGVEQEELATKHREASAAMEAAWAAKEAGLVQKQYDAAGNEEVIAELQGELKAAEADMKHERERQEAAVRAETEALQTKQVEEADVLAKSLKVEAEVRRGRAGGVESSVRAALAEDAAADARAEQWIERKKLAAVHGDATAALAERHAQQMAEQRQYEDRQIRMLRMLLAETAGVRGTLAAGAARVQYARDNNDACPHLHLLARLAVNEPPPAAAAPPPASRDAAAVPAGLAALFHLGLGADWAAAAAPPPTRRDGGLVALLDTEAPVVVAGGAEPAANAHSPLAGPSGRAGGARQTATLSLMAHEFEGTAAARREARIREECQRAVIEAHAAAVPGVRRVHRRLLHRRHLLAVLKIQRIARACTAGRYPLWWQRTIRTLEYSAIRIQCYARRVLAAIRLRYLKAAQVVKRCGRGMRGRLAVWMRRRERAAEVLQRAARARDGRYTLGVRYLAVNTEVIQRVGRAGLARAQAYVDRRDAAARVLQRLARGTAVRRAAYLEYLEAHARRLQRIGRASAVRFAVNGDHVRKNARYLQRLLRANAARREMYAAYLLASTKRLQRVGRATFTGRREGFMLYAERAIREGVLTLQCFARRQLAKAEVRRLRAGLMLKRAGRGELGRRNIYAHCAAIIVADETEARRRLQARWVKISVPQLYAAKQQMYIDMRRTVEMQETDGRQRIYEGLGPAMRALTISANHWAHQVQWIANFLPALRKEERTARAALQMEQRKLMRVLCLAMETSAAQVASLGLADRTGVVLLVKAAEAPGEMPGLRLVVSAVCEREIDRRQGITMLISAKTSTASRTPTAAAAATATAAVVTPTAAPPSPSAAVGPRVGDAAGALPAEGGADAAAAAAHAPAGGAREGPTATAVADHCTQQRTGSLSAEDAKAERGMQLMASVARIEGIDEVLDSVDPRPGRPWPARDSTPPATAAAHSAPSPPPPPPQQQRDADAHAVVTPSVAMTTADGKKPTRPNPKGHRRQLDATLRRGVIGQLNRTLLDELVADVSGGVASDGGDALNATGGSAATTAASPLKMDWILTPSGQPEFTGTMDRLGSTSPRRRMDVTEVMDGETVAHLERRLHQSELQSIVEGQSNALECELVERWTAIGNRCATLIQKWFKGHSVRLKIVPRRDHALWWAAMEKQREREDNNEAARRIQRIVRGRQIRAHMANNLDVMRQVRAKRMQILMAQRMETARVEYQAAARIQRYWRARQRGLLLIEQERRQQAFRVQFLQMFGSDKGDYFSLDESPQVVDARHLVYRGWERMSTREGCSLGLKWAAKFITPEDPAARRQWRPPRRVDPTTSRGPLSLFPVGDGGRPTTVAEKLARARRNTRGIQKALRLQSYELPDCAKPADVRTVFGKVVFPDSFFGGPFVAWDVNDPPPECTITRDPTVTPPVVPGAPKDDAGNAKWYVAGEWLTLREYRDITARDPVDELLKAVDARYPLAPFERRRLYLLQHRQAPRRYGPKGAAIRHSRMPLPASGAYRVRNVLGFPTSVKNDREPSTLRPRDVVLGGPGLSKPARRRIDGSSHAIAMVLRARKRDELLALRRRAPPPNTAAMLIQKIWRAYYVRMAVPIYRRTRLAGARVLQRAGRGWGGRADAAWLFACKKAIAATRIQCLIRGYTERVECGRRACRARIEQRYKYRTSAATTIQRVYRGHCVRKAQRADRHRKRVAGEMAMARDAAGIITRWGRGCAVRLRLGRFKVAAERIQLAYRYHLFHVKMQARVAAVTNATFCLQRAVRSYWARRATGERRARRDAAVLKVEAVQQREYAAWTIQGWIRNQWARRIYEDEKAAHMARQATIIQSNFRGHFSRKQYRAKRAQLLAIAEVLQPVARGHDGRRAAFDLVVARARREEEAARRLQAFRRVVVATAEARLRRMERAVEAYRARAAMVCRTLQKAGRAMFVRRKLCILGEWMHANARSIQWLVYGWQVRKEVRPLLALRRASAIKIQAQWRRYWTVKAVGELLRERRLRWRSRAAWELDLHGFIEREKDALCREEEDLRYKLSRDEHDDYLAVYRQREEARAAVLRRARAKAARQQFRRETELKELDIMIEIDAVAQVVSRREKEAAWARFLLNASKLESEHEAGTGAIRREEEFVWSELIGVHHEAHRAASLAYWRDVWSSQERARDDAARAEADRLAAAEKRQRDWQQRYIAERQHERELTRLEETRRKRMTHQEKCSEFKKNWIQRRIDAAKHAGSDAPAKASPREEESTHPPGRLPSLVDAKLDLPLSRANSIASEATGGGGKTPRDGYIGGAAPPSGTHTPNPRAAYTATPGGGPPPQLWVTSKRAAAPKLPTAADVGGKKLLPLNESVVSPPAPSRLLRLDSLSPLKATSVASSPVKLPPSGDRDSGATPRRVVEGVGRLEGAAGKKDGDTPDLALSLEPFTSAWIDKRRKLDEEERSRHNQGLPTHSIWDVWDGTGPMPKHAINEIAFPPPRAKPQRDEAEVALRERIQRYIVQLAANDPTMTEVNLSGAKIADVHLYAFLRGLKGNRTCRTLVLDGNGIDDVTVGAIIKVLLLPGCAVTRVSLEGNSISDEGARLLSRAAKQRADLQSVSLAGNPVSEHVRTELERFLEKRSVMGTLNKMERIAAVGEM